MNNEPVTHFADDHTLARLAELERIERFAGLAYRAWRLLFRERPSGEPFDAQPFSAAFDAMLDARDALPDAFRRKWEGGEETNA